VGAGGAHVLIQMGCLGTWWFVGGRMCVCVWGGGKSQWGAWELGCFVEEAGGPTLR
jgi:hypothetical protein